MKHSDTTQREFTRQAQSFAASPELNADELVARIQRALGEARCGRILDLACGPGIVASALATDARELVAFDLTRRMAELARARCREAGAARVRVARGSGEALPFGDGAFDAVVSRLAVHHFESPGAVLAEARRATRPGGRVVLLDLVSDADPATAELHNALERLRDPSHVRMLPADELVAATREAGFTDVSCDVWTRVRDFDDWAAVIADPVRMSSLEVVMRHLARAGTDLGIGLREEAAALRFDYRWALVVGRAPGS